jgi:hypothetical protein
VSRWRNIFLILLLATCAFSLWWARREPAAVTKAPPAVAPAPPEDGGPALASIHLAVLNGTGEAGLARRVSRRMPEHGCVVVEMADAPHDTFARSLLVNRRLGEEQARRLAASLGGLPVLREWDPRRREDAVLVLGHDHRRLAPAAGW